MTNASDVSKDNMIGGDSVKIKAGDTNVATDSLVLSDNATTSAATSSQVEIPSAAMKSQALSSSDADDLCSMPPPAVIRATPPSTALVKAGAASTSVGRDPPVPDKTTSSLIKKEIKQVPGPTQPASTSSNARSENNNLMVPPNPVARTAGSLVRTPIPQPIPSAAVPAPSAKKLHGNVHGTVYPNPITSSSVPKPASQYEHNIISTSSDMSVTNNSSASVSTTKKKTSHPLRRGKWTAEEEAYANRLIQEFKSGLLPLTDGTTLRNYLAKLLNVDPMRIR